MILPFVAGLSSVETVCFHLAVRNLVFDFEKALLFSQKSRLSPGNRSTCSSSGESF